MEKTLTDSKFPSGQLCWQATIASLLRWRSARGVVFVVGILALAVTVFGGTKQSADIPGVQEYSNLGAAHTTAPVRYDPIPPVGGNHSSTLLNCGIYDKPVANENAVHSLEHGAVWITYQSTLSESAVGKLRRLVKGHDHAILSPYLNLPSLIVASGWGVQLKLTEVDDPRLLSFIEKYERGPQTPEPGASCIGGIGTPIKQ